MRKFLYLLSIGLFSLTLTTTYPILATESSNEETSQTTIEIDALEIPNEATWDEMTLQEQVQWLVEYVYIENQAGRPVTLNFVEDFFGEADEILNNHEEVSNLSFFFNEEDQYDLELKLAVANEEEQVLEALAILNYLESDEVQFDPVSVDAFKEAGEVLKENYKNKQDSQFEDVEEFLGQPNKISYLYDIEIYHYPGLEDHEEIALSQSDEQILALNYLNLDPKLLEEAIPAEKRELDLISHTSGYTWQEMVNKFGQPMGINYNSEQGIIGLSWYSEAEDSVGEVYFYMAYDEIPIGTTYR